MSIRIPALLSLALVFSALSGCTNAEGRFRPIDPLGRMLFDAIDRGPSQPSHSDRSRSPGPDYVWIDGFYGHDGQGRTVWIPGHWARSGEAGY